MGYSVSFTDNAYYGADDINAVRSAFATMGVVRKSTDSCAVSVENGKIRINEGSALFDDGTEIKVTGIEELDMADGFVFFDKQLSCARVGDTLPDGAVLLARVTDGAVTDRRIFSSLAVPTMAVNGYYTKAVHIGGANTAGRIELAPVEFDEVSSFRYLIISTGNAYCTEKALCDFEGDSGFGYIRRRSSYSSYSGYDVNSEFVSVTLDAFTRLECRRDGNRLNMTLLCENAQFAGADITMTVM